MKNIKTLFAPEKSRAAVSLITSQPPSRSDVIHTNLSFIQDEPLYYQPGFLADDLGASMPADATASDDPHHVDHPHNYFIDHQDDTGAIHSIDADTSIIQHEPSLEREHDISTHHQKSIDKTLSPHADTSTAQPVTSLEHERGSPAHRQKDSDTATPVKAANKGNESNRSSEQ